MNREKINKITFLHRAGGETEIFREHPNSGGKYEIKETGATNPLQKVLNFYLF
ncbi:MAG: hypothetical protein QXW78_00535 [Candidatus Thermoplasmatota archaeon]